MIATMIATAGCRHLAWLIGAIASNVRGKGDCSIAFLDTNDK